MKNHKWVNIGALQWGALGLSSSDAASYEQCELCGARLAIHYNSGEGLAEAMANSKISPECPTGIEATSGGKKIFCFCNGGSPGWYSAVAICEDGVCVAGHACSSPGWCQYDLGIGSDRKHNLYKKHCPDGYELVWVDNPKNHAGLDKAIELNRQLKFESEKSVELQKT